MILQLILPPHPPAPVFYVSRKHTEHSHLEIICKFILKRFIQFIQFFALFLSDAQVYCPERYKTMLKWQDLARNTIARIRPKLTSLFYFTGNKTTVPTCPVSMAINFHPLFSVQSYRSGTSTCQGPGLYRLPFFVDRMGPKFLEVAVNAHEANPGHHTQMQGYFERFR